MGNNDDVKIYKLAGKSLKAAQDLNDLLTRFKPTQLKAAWMKPKLEPLMRTIGLASNAVQVKIRDGALPRAYNCRPSCYVGMLNEFTAYITSPVDYKGRHFVPEDAVLIENPQMAIGSSVLEPIMPRAHQSIGTQMPADFDKTTDRFTAQDPLFDYRATERFQQGIERMKLHYCEAVIARWWDNDPANIALNTRLMASDNGHAQMVLSAKDTRTGESLKLRSSPWVAAEPLADNEYLMKPNVKCAGGMVLQDSLDAIPPLPDKEALWLIANANDEAYLVVPPPPPRELLYLDPKAAWPFPKSPPAP